jgi:hypothetical protein
MVAARTWAKKFLTDVCEKAHPNPKHYLRRHIDQWVSHSFRVTAAVALANATVHIDDISLGCGGTPTQ